jgi:SAM-dependent methyltransferase
VSASAGGWWPRLTRWLSFAWLYLFHPPWDSGIPAPELVRAVAECQPGRALDLGCGTGTNVRYLAERGWRVTGVDFVPLAIARARRKLRGLDAQLLVGDVTQLEDLPLPGPYDLALDMGCFHSLPPEGRACYAAGLARCLRPGARYLLYAFLPSADRHPGLARAEVEAAFAPALALSGYEEGQGRPSAWYYFEKQ